MGTDSFASSSLSALLKHRNALLSSIHVVTPPDTNQKWGAARMKVSPVKALALTSNLAHQHVPSEGMKEYTLPCTFPLDPNSILLTCSFGHLIPDALLDKFPNPWQRLNIHPSLLPQLRGAAPIQWAIAKGFDRSGVSIQTLEKGKFDTGRIVAQESFLFPPPPSTTAAYNELNHLTTKEEWHQAGFLQVEERMAIQAADLLIKTLSDLNLYWQRSWDQNHQERSFAPKLKPSHTLIRWDTWTAAHIAARERAMGYMYPLSTTLHPPPTPINEIDDNKSRSSTFRPVNVNFSNTHTISLTRLLQNDEPKISMSKTWVEGSAWFSPVHDALIVKTYSGERNGKEDEEVLAVRTIKVAGKKPKSATEFFKSYKDRTHPSSGLFSFQ
nr:related to methionyl-trna formyltransferase [Melanopsichium pennsylvanicum 4]